MICRLQAFCYNFPEMKPGKNILFLAFSLALALSNSSAADELFFRLIAPPKLQEQIPFHQPVLDDQGKLLPWSSYDHILHLAMGFIENCPRDKITGLPWYEQYCDFRFQTMTPDHWPHNPAGLYGMMVETLTRWYPYTGDAKWIEITRPPLDHLIAESTPAEFAWASVPYASADNSGHYQGGSKEKIHGIEPDKIGQAGVGYLRFYKITGEKKYLDQAVHCADVLAAKIRPGDKLHSPWPFRVNAQTGKIIEQYTSDALWPIALFDELSALGMDQSGKYARARKIAWDWLLKYPMQNNRWKGYFEDVIRDPANLNRDQYTPGELARYLMLHPELDPEWRTHVPALLSWVKKNLGDTRPKWKGATAIREQRLCMQVAGSHTARYASLNAMWFARGGGEPYREEALRAFALASYLARENGIVVFSIVDQDVWFSDGYFDYVPHFIDGMAGLPQMAPANQDHLLHSSSIITRICYAPQRISYSAFDPQGTEIFKLSFAPSRVLADGIELKAIPCASGLARDSFPAPPPGFCYNPKSQTLKISRLASRQIAIE